jgi:hypothetical protein
MSVAFPGKIVAVADPGASGPVLVGKELLRHLFAAGVTDPGDGRRLTVDQMEAVLADKDTGERMRLKMLMARDNVLPAELMGRPGF